MLSRYAGVGTTCPQFTVTTESGGNLTGSGSLYFSFQLQNRAGFNAPSVSSQISYTAGQKIVITIPDTVRKAGWDIHYFEVSAGATSDPSTHVALTRYSGFQFGVGIDPQTLLSTLPATIELSRDLHIALAPTVANLAALPTGNDRLDGQVRWVTSESKWFEYRADSDQEIGVNVIAADVGQWVRVASASTYVSSSTDAGGSDHALPTIEPTSIVATPDYPGNNLGKVLPTWESRYVIYNDTDISLPEGIEFGIELEYNNLRSPDLLSGLFMVEFKGFVQADGNLRTTRISDSSEFNNIGGYVPWTPKLTTNFLLPDGLLPTESILIAVKPFFSSAELDFYSDYRSGSTGMSSGDIVGIKPVIRTQSGDYNPLGKLLNDGSVILNLGDQYRVVPDNGLSYKVLSGCALVKSYDFPTKPTRSFSGLAVNTADQKIVINGNGSVFTELDSYTVQSSEALRAIVSTELGESHAGSFSSYIANSGTSSFNITLNYPCTAGGLGTIRSNYPDVIASNAKGSFNPVSINIYLQRQDNLEIRKFTGNGVVPGTSQQFSITDWTNGTIVGSLPNAEFGLFTPGSSSLVIDGAGSFPVTSYRVTYSFVYDGNQITDIDHSSPPCIYEWQGDLQPPSITVISTTTIAQGEDADVVNVGTGSAAELEFYLPPGEVKAVADIVALTAIAPANRSNGLVVAVQDSGDTTPKIYIFDSDATTGGETPDTGTGRWVAASSAGGSGGVDITRTSTTSNTISTGSITFTYAASSSLGWLIGTRLRAANDASNYLEGVVTAVSSTSVTILSDNILGSGTFTSWNITLAGDKGTPGNADITRTSTTSNVIGTGSKTFSFPATTNLGWLVGTRLRAANDSSNYLEGAVTAVSGSSVSINSDNTAGSGTFTSWNLTLTGDKGATGTGTTGAQGQPSYSNTTSNFVQPGSGSNITIELGSSAWAVVGANVSVATGGTYQVISKPSAVTLEIQNLATETTNTGVGATISSGALVSPTGTKGNAGATGSVSAASGLILNPASSITTGVNEFGFYFDITTGFPVYQFPENGATAILGNYQIGTYYQPTTTPTTPSTAHCFFLDVTDDLFKRRRASDGAVDTFTFYGNDLFKYQLMYG